MYVEISTFMGTTLGLHNIQDVSRIPQKYLEVCPFRDLSLGNRDPYVGILIPTCDTLPKGILGNVVLLRNR